MAIAMAAAVVVVAMAAAMVITMQALADPTGGKIKELIKPSFSQPKSSLMEENPAKHT